MARCDLGQGHQTVSQHRIEIGDGVRQRLIEQQVEGCSQWSRDRDFGPRVHAAQLMRHRLTPGARKHPETAAALPAPRS